MKKRVVLVFLILLLPLISSLPNETITGKVSQAPTNVSIFVLPGAPVIQIYSPEEKTYSETTILLNYTIRNGFDQAWYNLDNSNNISLSNLADNSISFTSALGTHTLYIYANNSQGYGSKNVNFTITSQPVTPPSNPGTSGSGGGGGGGGGVSIANFVSDKKLVEVSLIQGESKQGTIKLTNTGNKIIDLSFKIEELNDNAILNENSLKLNPGESKDIEINFFALGKTPAKIYPGKLIITSESIKKEILLIMDVKQREVLFDVNLKVLPNYKQASSGDKISVLIDMTNIGLMGTDVDVDLTLSVMDFNKKILYESFKETLAVKSELSVTRKLQLPEDMQEGTYIAQVELTYQNITASSYDTFDLKQIIYSSNWIWVTIVSLIIAIIIALIIIRVLHAHKGKKRKKRR